jgi:hypothetical protein
MPGPNPTPGRPIPPSPSPPPPPPPDPPTAAIAGGALAFVAVLGGLVAVFLVCWRRSGSATAAAGAVDPADKQRAAVGGLPLAHDGVVRRDPSGMYSMASGATPSYGAPMQAQLSTPSGVSVDSSIPHLPPPPLHLGSAGGSVTSGSSVNAAGMTRVDFTNASGGRASASRGAQSAATGGTEASVEALETELDTMYRVKV